MTRDKLCSEIARRENKKVSVSIGNIREIMRIIIDMQVEFNTSDTICLDDSPVFVILKEVDKKVEKAIAKELKKKPKKSQRITKMIKISWMAIILAFVFVAANIGGMYLLRNAPLGW